MLPIRPVRLPFRSISRGGFTLVELLVVIAIIAGVAFGPITQGLEKAKESAGMQTSRTIALAMFQYQVDNGSYPGGNKSEDVAVSLVQGGYVTDPSLFAASKDKAYAGTTQALTAGGMQAVNICWDFFVESSQNTAVTPPVYYGLSTSDPDGMPAVFSTGQNINEPPAQGGASGSPITMGTTNPFGNNGMAVCFKSNSAQFLKAINMNGNYQVSTSTANYLFGPSFTCTPSNYIQIKP
jgi:prepilin-type N-terminal cleavage/methylation domain-containing protein